MSQDPSGNAQIRDSEEESRAPQRRQQERSGNTIKKRRSRFNRRTGLGPLSEWMGHQEQQGRSHYRQTPPTPKDFRVSNEGATILPLARLVEEEEDKERKSAWVPCPTVTHVGGNAINTPDTAPHSNSEAEIELVRGGVVVDDEDNAGWGITSSTKPWAVDAEDVTPL